MERMKNKLIVLLLAVAMLLATAAATSANNNMNIVETAAAAGQFETLVAALEATGLDAVLSDESRNFTVFAPTDDAFAALGQDTIDALLADPETLSNILLYHVVADKYKTADRVLNRLDNQIVTATGDRVYVSIRDGEVFINNSQVIVTDVIASNGVIHVIDTVLLPPQNVVEFLENTGQHNTLLAALELTGLDDVLRSADIKFTIFAPKDEAFAALGQDAIDALLADPEALSNVLLYHAVVDRGYYADRLFDRDGHRILMANGDRAEVNVRDGKLFVEDSMVTVADIRTPNGFIHFIDSVLIPPANIVEVAEAAGQFNTLLAALEATGLDEVLSDETTRFTVFAPTDDAFAALGQDTIDALLADPETLSDILLYHVVVNRTYKADRVIGLDGRAINMANGDRVHVTVDGGVFINDAQVIVTDVMASNGVIHVIDAVLIPPAE